MSASNSEPRRKDWNAIYESEVLTRRRRSGHLAKLRKAGFFDIPRHSRILDLGCGTGEMLDILAEEGFDDLTGMDRYQPSGHSSKRWCHVQGSAEKLPFGAEKFDAILCAHALHHISWEVKIDTFFAEVARCLKPGGTFFLIDHYDSLHLRAALWVLRSPLAQLHSWSAAFREQIRAEHRELYRYLDRWGGLAKKLRDMNFEEKKMRKDLFFFYFSGKKASR